MNYRHFGHHVIQLMAISQTFFPKCNQVFFFQIFFLFLFFFTECDHQNMRCGTRFLCLGFIKTILVVLPNNTAT